MLSSKDGLFDRARGRMVGSDQYLTKPFTQETLIDAVQPMLRLVDPIKKRVIKHGNSNSLVVDDSATDRFFLTELLETAGFTVIGAESGESV